MKLEKIAGIDLKLKTGDDLSISFGYTLSPTLHRAVSRC